MFSVLFHCSKSNNPDIKLVAKRPKRLLDGLFHHSSCSPTSALTTSMGQTTIQTAANEINEAQLFQSRLSSMQVPNTEVEPPEITSETKETPLGYTSCSIMFRLFLLSIGRGTAAIYDDFPSLRGMNTTKTERFYWLVRPSFLSV